MQDAKKSDIDLLNHPVCNNLRENGFCKTSSYIKNKLCHATCRKYLSTTIHQTVDNITYRMYW